MQRLTHKSVLITGASSGIGRAIALRFAAEGARLILADITTSVREGGVPTIDLLREQGMTAEHVTTDVSCAEQVQSAVALATRQYGRLDVLVNDAAISVGKNLLDTLPEEWDRVMAVNLRGAFLMAQAAVRAMVQQPPIGEARGRIVNISSQHGMISAPNNIAYGASKAGLVYLTRQIAADYAGQGIICNAVAPGKIVTGKNGPAATPEAMAYSVSRTPWPRLGRPEDVAAAALFLASDEASFITGENLLTDGGWMAA